MQNNVTLKTTAALIVLTGAVEGTVSADMIGQFVDTMASKATDKIGELEKTQTGSPKFNLLCKEIDEQADEAVWVVSKQFVTAFCACIVGVVHSMTLERKPDAADPVVETEQPAADANSEAETQPAAEIPPGDQAETTQDAPAAA